MTRRDLLQSAFSAAWPVIAFARESRNLALTLAQFLNRTRFENLPPKAIEHAKMIIASTLASAAPGSRIDSARIVRELAKEGGGKPEATVWFDGAKLPLNEAARVNAMLSDARQGFHASVIVAFGGVVAAARLLKLTDEQLAHAIGLTATTMGGLAIG